MDVLSHANSDEVLGDGDGLLAGLDRLVDGIALGHEVHIGDGAVALVAELRLHPHAGGHGVDRSGVDGMDQRGVGPVEADQREGERVREGVLLGWLGHPCPAFDDAARSDLDEIGDELVPRFGVEFQWRTQNPVTTTNPEHPAISERGEEGTQDRTGGPGVGVGKGRIDGQVLTHSAK